MAAHSRRLSILSAAEINDLYGLPNFTQDERSLYFDLSARESAVVGQVRTASVAMHLILQLGYFKAKSQFFVYEQRAVLEDLDYIIGRYFPDRDLALSRPPPASMAILPMCGSMSALIPISLSRPIVASSSTKT